MPKGHEMWKKLILFLVFLTWLGHFKANADVIVDSVILAPSKILLEPLPCPTAETDKRCFDQAKPRGDPATWVNLFDYPSRAERTNQSGAVILQLEIDRTRGRPNSCRVVKSSGFELLDKQSCLILQRRARFVQQPDANGAASPLYFDVRIIWLAPWIQYF